MKTKILKAIAAFCLILIFLFGCAEVDSMNYKKLADTINEASDFGGYRLLDNYTGTPENYDPEHPETTRRLGQDGKMELEGTYFYFPNDNGSVCLTFMNIESDKYSILGVRPGDTLEEAVSVFTAFGFVEDVALRKKIGAEIRERENQDPYYFDNGWAHITISTDLSDEQLLTGLQIGFIDPTERDYVL